MKSHKEEKKEKNIYKFTTYVLLILLVLVGVIFGFVTYGDSRFQAGVATGQLSTVQFIAANVANSGFVDINQGNQSLRLVPAQTIGLAQQNVLGVIINQIEQTGFIVLDNKGEELILVQAPEGTQVVRDGEEPVEDTEQ